MVRVSCPVYTLQFFSFIGQLLRVLSLSHRFVFNMKLEYPGRKVGLNILFGLLFCFFASAWKRFSPPKYSACHSKDFGYGGTVCVCSDQLGCDSFSEGSPLSDGEYAVYTSSKAGDRFSLKTGKIKKGFDERKSGEVNLTVQSGKHFQTILGFGGAFTDAFGINIWKLSYSLRGKLLLSYFSAEGIEYSLGRVPIASCDFSTYPYSYDDYEGDFHLTNFSLTKEDLTLKIPFMKIAMWMSKRGIRFFGSPWSAPAWMKTTGKMEWGGKLKGVAGDKYHKTWARYFVKFLEAYKRFGVPIWGLTVQNEPLAGFIPKFPFQSMAYTPGMERDFVKQDLGPTLAKFGYSDVRLMMFDDSRPHLKEWAIIMLSDPQTAKYISGIAVHWYDNRTPATILTDTHNKFPNHFILNTEACAGWMGPPPVRGVHLGEWSRGNQYSYTIIEDLSHWSTGWVDWNLALDMEGGPNWVKNFVDSPVIVDAENGVFYKQPMYYHLGHFSKFVPPGSKRIKVTSARETSLKFIGFVTPWPYSNTVVVVLNIEAKNFTINITDRRGGVITETVPSNSIQTYIW